MISILPLRSVFTYYSVSSYSWSMRELLCQQLGQTQWCRKVMGPWLPVRHLGQAGLQTVDSWLWPQANAAVGLTSAPRVSALPWDSGCPGHALLVASGRAQEQGQKCVKLFEAVNPEKNYIYQNGLLMANWAQIHHQSLAAIAHPPTHAACGEKPQAELSTANAVSCLFTLQESATIRTFLVSSVSQWTETCPIQSELHKLYPHLQPYQQELHNLDQSDYMNWKPHLHETNQNGNYGQQVSL